MLQGDFYLDAVATQVAMGKTSTGKEQLAISFDVDQNSASQDPGIPRRATAYLYFTEKAMETTEKALRALGWDPISNGWDLDALIERGLIYNQPAQLTCCFEEYQGQMKFRVNFVNEPGGGVLKERMESHEVKSFQATLRQRVGMVGAPVGSSRPAPAPARASQGPPADDPRFGGDDIPF